MNIDNIELCWNVFLQYIKPTDRSNAVNHLVNELIDLGIGDEEIKELKNIDQYFYDAVDEYDIIDDDDDWNDEDEL